MHGSELRISGLLLMLGITSVNIPHICICGGASCWAFEKGVPLFSSAAEKTKKADVKDSEFDSRIYVFPFTFFFGLLGI